MAAVFVRNTFKISVKRQQVDKHSGISSGSAAFPALTVLKVCSTSQTRRQQADSLGAAEERFQLADFFQI